MRLFSWDEVSRIYTELRLLLMSASSKALRGFELTPRSSLSLPSDVVSVCETAKYKCAAWLTCAINDRFHYHVQFSKKSFQFTFLWLLILKVVICKFSNWKCGWGKVLCGPKLFTSLTNAFKYNVHVYTTASNSQVNLCKGTIQVACNNQMLIFLKILINSLMAYYSCQVYIHMTVFKWQDIW